jgi:WD40 repeat protein
MAAAVNSVFLHVAACSYEGSLFGWSIVENPVEQCLDLSMDFGFSTNRGSLRCIAVSKSGKYLAVAGADERIKVFNVQEKKSLGDLAGHSGSINSLEFFEDSVLISASDVCATEVELFYLLLLIHYCRCTMYTFRS